MPRTPSLSNLVYFAVNPTAYPSFDQALKAKA